MAFGSQPVVADRAISGETGEHLSGGFYRPENRPVPANTTASVQAPAQVKPSNAIGPAPLVSMDRGAWAVLYFWLKVRKGDDCWTWTAATNDRGYGYIGIGGRTLAAHRVSLWLINGEWPLDRQACHKCDNTSCVRPDHLYWGLPFQNRLDSVVRGQLYQRGRKRSRLNAAAPDLLAALRAMVLNAPYHKNCSNSLPVTQALAAIAKAEGRK